MFARFVQVLFPRAVAVVCLPIAVVVGYLGSQVERTIAPPVEGRPKTTYDLREERRQRERQAKLDQDALAAQNAVAVASSPTPASSS
ncbi:hypothetical protein CAOG_08652 [Capsaspora owczarzaki ATCC 30864]|uniref:Uncharacterized protein n=1 Tax=Capsaspora owczarzaki (strain ATCC 30864) TaxID=595528 RepID=A0A0D2UA85_CAPO3|nr:hypothetical protein CAOG_08652 [Capsaspora owczarzaki ATCC 30864]KJE91966.1 hypothetical protein CAOG_008652 [Capsaspora owczarzaki ATCC 30864]|eukprot:XP_011270263.1 hypothetical protein CAOG_08652 [Capsaspora owczarzaki ATCC 30864]